MQQARPHAGIHNLLHVAAAGGAIRIDRLRVFHDVYYKSLRGPTTPAAAGVELPPGAMYLLGDNTFDSRDSRMGLTFLLSDLVGRPLGVIGPLARMRWLTR